MRETLPLDDPRRLSDICNKMVHSPVPGEAVTISKDPDGIQVIDEGSFGGYVYGLLDAVAKPIEYSPVLGWQCEHIRIKPADYTPEKACPLCSVQLSWTAWFYDIPSGTSQEAIDRNKAAIEQEMLDHEVTIAWPSKGIVGIRFSYPDGTAVPWGELRIFGLRASEKLPKRMSALNWQQYLFAEMKIVFIPQARKMKPREGIFSIKVIDAEDWLEETVTDGIAYMRPSMLRYVVDQLDNRVMDPEKRAYIKEELLEVLRLNYRFMTPIEYIDGREVGGQFKGDVEVADTDEALDADFVVYAHNGKDEFFCTQPGMGLFIAQPREQKDNVKSNTQLLCHFGQDFLFRHEEGRALEMALDREIERRATEFEEGDRAPVFALKPSHIMAALHTQQEKFNLFARAGLQMNASLKMQSMYAKLLKDTYKPDPKKGPETRKFPLVRARYVSLSSEKDVKMGGYMPTYIQMKAHEAFVRRHIGLIVSDELYPRVAAILGGGDKDDHVIVIPYIAGCDDVITKAEPDIPGPAEIHIRKGDLILWICRSPIGAGFGIDPKTGEKVVASEYFILKASNREKKQLLKKWGLYSPENPDGIPELDLSRRPRIIDEVLYPDDMFESTPREMGDEYTFAECMDIIEASIGVGKAYADHANLVMIAAMYGIPLTHFAREEVFIDVQQKPNKADVKRMMQINAIHAAEIAHWFRKNNKAMDMHMMHRVRSLGFKKGKKYGDIKIDNNGYFVNLVKFHVAQINYLNRRMADHLRGPELRRHRALVEDIVINRFATDDLEGMPIEINEKDKAPKLITRIRQIRAALRTRWGLGTSDNLNYAQHAEVGNLMAERLRVMNVPEAQIHKDFLQAWAYSVRHTIEGPRKNAEERLSGTDWDLLHGELIVHYINMLTEEYPRRSGIPLRPVRVSWLPESEDEDLD